MPIFFVLPRPAVWLSKPLDGMLVGPKEWLDCLHFGAVLRGQ
jgi:hypothetical protein